MQTHSHMDILFQLTISFARNKQMRAMAVTRPTEISDAKVKF